MKSIFFLAIFALFASSAICFQHKARSLSKIFIPSIVFPDVIPIGRGLFFRRHHSEPKNLTILHKNSTQLKNDTFINENSRQTSNITKSLINLEINKDLLITLANNTNQNNISENRTNEYNGKDNNTVHNAKQSFHFLGCLAYIKKETLTSQLLLCLSMFALVLIVIFCVQCFIQANEKKEKEFQRIFKMAVSENC